jgi:hypothetical protein
MILKFHPINEKETEAESFLEPQLSEKEQLHITAKVADEISR